MENRNKKKKIGNNISDIVFVIIKWKTIKEQYKRKRKELKLIGYVLSSMVRTRDTAHFERSLLNAYASLNAVQIIQ